jgi:hypothetical protein
MIMRPGLMIYKINSMPAGKELFQKYMNPVFIETGSLVGDGIQHALNAGFKTVYSIELSKALYDICVNRFKSYDNVHIILGDSSKELDLLLNMIKEPATFWLDGHDSGGGTARGEIESPLMQELEIISKHPIKTHTLIIDDLRCWHKEIQGFDTEIIKSKCLEINPGYSFIFEDGFIENDILVAKI